MKTVKPTHKSINRILTGLFLLLLIRAAYTETLASGQSQNEYEFNLKWYSKNSNLRSLAVDNAGNVYVASAANHNIQKFSTDGLLLATWGGKGSSDGQLNYPEGIAVDDKGYVYVCDQNNHRIQKFTSDGTYVTKWGSKGSGDGEFNVARSIAVDSDGFVYIADALNRRIQKFTSEGGYVNKWGSEGTGDGQFITEFFVAVSDSGYVYVSDGGNNRVQKFTSSGEFVAKWGSQGTGNGQFTGLKSLAIDGSGYIYTVESLNSRIQKFAADGTFLATWGEYGTIIDGQLRTPLTIAVDGLGNVYAPDSVGGRIQKFSTTLNTVLKIIVIDEDGTPQTGAKVTLNTQPVNQPQLIGNTDLNGTVYFPGVQNGSYSVAVEKSGFSTSESIINVDEGEVKEVTITIDSGPVLADLKVTIRDAEGKPIPGAAIDSTKQPSGQSKLSGTTTTEGIAEWKGIALGEYTIVSSKSEYISVTTQIFVDQGVKNEVGVTLQKQSIGGIPGYPNDSIVLAFLTSTVIFSLARKDGALVGKLGR